MQTAVDSITNQTKYMDYESDKQDISHITVERSPIVSICCVLTIVSFILCAWCVRSCREKDNPSIENDTETDARTEISKQQQEGHAQVRSISTPPTLESSIAKPNPSDHPQNYDYLYAADRPSCNEQKLIMLLHAEQPKDDINTLISIKDGVESITSVITPEGQMTQKLDKNTCIDMNENEICTTEIPKCLHAHLNMNASSMESITERYSMSTKL